MSGLIRLSIVVACTVLVVACGGDGQTASSVVMPGERGRPGLEVPPDVADRPALQAPGAATSQQQRPAG